MTRADLGRAALEQVMDATLLVHLNVVHHQARELSMVRHLPARLGVESRAVQDDARAPLPRRQGLDPRLELEEERVLPVQALGHPSPWPPSLWGALTAVGCACSVSTTR